MRRRVGAAAHANYVVFAALLRRRSYARQDDQRISLTNFSIRRSVSDISLDAYIVDKGHDPLIAGH